AWLLSEGMRRIVAIFALLEARPRPSLLAIEEIENGLDPWTLAYVLGELHQASAEGVQVIVTTHSPFLLDHVDIDEVIHVHRRSGESTYQRVTDLPKVAKYKGVLAPGAMYLRKLFGSEEMEPRAAKR
ncbi:MAG TPA: ATP-binding protein, partial [Kofleriaceae bacterium]|nr:ATP-binding protein [Kofleriaceae bacterium]